MTIVICGVCVCADGGQHPVHRSAGLQGDGVYVEAWPGAEPAALTSFTAALFLYCRWTMCYCEYFH